MNLGPQPPRRRNSIVLIALVDVLFVLLMFFLLASTALVPAALPLALAAAGEPLPQATLVLRTDRTVLVNGAPHSIAGGLMHLRETGVTAVQLQAGDGVTLHDLVQVIEVLRPAGITPLLARAP